MLELFLDVVLIAMTSSTIFQFNLERYWAFVLKNMAWKPFLALSEIPDEHFSPLLKVTVRLY